MYVTGSSLEGRVGRVIAAKNVKTRLDEMNAASLFSLAVHVGS